MTQPAPKKKQRSCVACGAKGDKAALLRIVRDPSGAVSFDATGRAPGRGAYICSAACFAAARTSGKLGRALRTKLGDEDAERIAGALAKASGRGVEEE